VYALLRSLFLIGARDAQFASRPLSAIASPPKVSPVSWREEYADGKWDRLQHIGELGHYSAIAGYFGRVKPGGSILDVGCGEGVLQRQLKPHGYSRYLGIDLTPEAVATAADGEDAITAFAVADATQYVPEEAFDVIIFSECLYYFKDPMHVLERYSEFLDEEGVFIISNYNCLFNLGMLRSIRQVMSVEDEVSIINRDGISWTVQLARPER
jgi:2-polyprenyl-3-methyl-5-hydroxy-6-metoxy-1,4-benzoquinol methylase